MRIYIQSKSGDHNSSNYHSTSLTDMMKTTRRLGYYIDDEGRCVPFEEVQFMKEERE